MHTLHGCMLAYSRDMLTQATFRRRVWCIPVHAGSCGCRAWTAHWWLQTEKGPLCAGLAGAWIGLTVQHCGNHGAMSTKAWVNKLMGLTDDLIGGSSLMWRYHHQASLSAASQSTTCGLQLVTPCFSARPFLLWKLWTPFKLGSTWGLYPGPKNPYRFCELCASRWLT